MRLLMTFAMAACCAPAHAQDVQRGKLLYETHCDECHYERVHERVKSDVKDLGELRLAVARRALETSRRRFSADELRPRGQEAALSG